MMYVVVVPKKKCRQERRRNRIALLRLFFSLSRTNNESLFSPTIKTPLSHRQQFFLVRPRRRRRRRRHYSFHRRHYIHQITLSPSETSSTGSIQNRSFRFN